jgi:hypothetical protein
MSWPNSGAGFQPAVRTSRFRRRGQSLIEFAVVALVTYMLLAAIITFGFYFYAAQGTQTAVDLAAREISRTPLPADTHDLETVLRGNANADPELADVRGQIYDDHYLVLNLDTLHGYPTLQDLMADLPIVNQQLVPLMIYDEVQSTRVLRYPGAILEDSNTADDPADPPPSGFLVAIPLVISRDSSGVETIDWIAPVEPIVRGNAGRADPFRITAEERGIVGLRINYPAQSSTMSSFRANPAGPFEPTIGNPNGADDSGVTVVDNDGFTPAGTVTQSDSEFGTYSGSFGLGKQAALASPQLMGDATGIRPFRRVISAQAIYRREVFE